jgi:ubiquinone/menaquinone biosynthesis C-methylase UbiE
MQKGLVMDIFRRVQAGYDQIVLEYAKRNHFKMPSNLVLMAQGLLQHTGLSGRIIDIGCGTGRDMAWFESEGANVTGIDLSMGMLTYARSKVNSNLFLMNMRQLGIRNASFDGAWCCASLLHLPKSEAVYALQEIHRILKLSGMLVLSIQEGNGEEWEESYVPDVTRFFARNQVSEMTDVLSRSGFSIQKADSSQETYRKWLSFVCLAE